MTGSFPLTGFYTPKSFVTHAALLRQAFAHCAIFPTAASRRSLGRISVPVWPITLSGRLSIVALVGRYPTNKLMDRGPIPRRRPKPPLILKRCHSRISSGIRPPFGSLSQTVGQVAHVLRTRSPLYSHPEGYFLARLACMKHAASVRSEPGSNSPWEISKNLYLPRRDDPNRTSGCSNFLTFGNHDWLPRARIRSHFRPVIAMQFSKNKTHSPPQSGKLLK